VTGRTAQVLERAWIGGAVHDDVLVEIEDGRFASVAVGAPGTDAPRVPGLTLPGFANAHSHAFHRALRGGAEEAGGSFWSWREQMYDVAASLDPESYYHLALATYREMVAAGYTSVAEFHYLHHQPNGAPYDDPNAMGHAVIEAAREAGIRLTLLDTCYLTGGIDQPLQGAQRRFGDKDAADWAERVARLDHPYVGAAIHSVRAVPADQIPVIVDAAVGRPLHVHLSEQPAENEQCRAAHGVTSTELLATHGALGPRTTAVHVTHPTAGDIRLLADSGTTACICPTTEADLGDGLGPTGELRDAGVALSIGSDGQTVIDPFTEMRQLELHERLRTGRRGILSTAERIAAGTNHASAGFPDAGTIRVGDRADLVTIRLDSPRTSGTDDPVAVATAADVTRVLVDGRVVS
jgi:formiminoglutamate deiminase